MPIADYTEVQYVSLATRTLATAGYEIEGAERFSGHTEILCSRRHPLGPKLKFLVAIRTSGEFVKTEREQILEAAINDSRNFVCVGFSAIEGQLTWNEFLAVSGGEVPSWQALGDSYRNSLITASLNDAPADYEGEAWLAFEGLVAAGIEFALGRRVQQLGGRQRGRTVSDMIGSLPTSPDTIMVIDAKATGKGFDAGWPNLRALVEYVNRQKQRQTGGVPVYGALVVSSSFKQSDGALKDHISRFAAETTGCIVSFLTAEVLAEAVSLMKSKVDIRSSMRWKTVFSGGLISIARIQAEITAAESERYV